MESKPRTPGETLPDGFDPALLARELVSFQDELAHPITAKRLDRWIGRIESRETLLSDTVWGTIRWAKSLGRPLVHSMSDAFVVTHTHEQSVKQYIDGGIQYVDIVVPHINPSKWDGPDDDDYHRVSFMAEAAAGLVHKIAVDFALHVQWQPRRPFVKASYRVLDPPLRIFLQGDRRTVLEPYKVIKKSFS